MILKERQNNMKKRQNKKEIKKFLHNMKILASQRRLTMFETEKVFAAVLTLDMIMNKRKNKFIQDHQQLI